MAEVTLPLTVNGETREVTAPPMARLLDVLREQCRLTGTKEGCGEGECGACSVLVDGVLVNSCLVPFAQASGSQITTIEGATCKPVQEAFIRCGGAQCGICTPGMIMATQALLAEQPRPTPEQVREGLAGNLCRCTGYTKIFQAVAEACGKP
jgi:carbon-monoxide dehydrogenase small subunit